MEIKKSNPKKNVEIKGYSANQSANIRNSPQQSADGYNAVQSSEIRKGYNSQMSTQARNEQPVKEGYNAQQMVQTANNPQSEQQSSQTKTAKSSDVKK